MKQFHQHLSSNLTWYRKWHDKPHHSVVHYGILLGVVMLCGAAFFGTAQAAGTTYYVDPSINDVNVSSASPDCTNYNPTTFTCGGGTASAYKTLADVNAKTFTAGDRILFKSGNTFYGALKVTASGTSTNPITYGSYGTGAKPILTGFTTLSGWTSLGSNKWESAALSASFADINVLSINGGNYAKGRLPKTGYWKSTTGGGTITDSTNLNASTTNWAGTGAQAVYRVQRWVLDKATITSATGSKINFSGNASSGWGYFLQNDPRMLSIQNEWSYNPTTKKITVYSTSTPTNVQAPTVDTGVDVNSKSNITFDGLDFVGFNSTGINTTASSNITVTNAGFSFIGVDGIYAYPNSGNLKVTDSTFSEINSRGIHGGSSSNAVISNNTLQNIGNLAGMGSNGDDSYTGIIAMGDNGVVSFNSIKNVGYVGIRWDGKSTQILNNLVDTTNYIKDDGGGIYSYPQNAGTAYTTEYHGFQRTVANNIVVNSVGAVAGGEASSTYSQGEGIYADGLSPNINFTNNTIYKAKLGLFINGGHEITASGNTVYDTERGINFMAIPDQNGTLQRAHDVSLQGNTLVARDSTSFTEYPMYVETKASTMATWMGGFLANNNKYARVRSASDTGLIWLDDNSGSDKHLALSAWRTFSSQDANSSEPTVSLTTSANLLFDYATFNSKTINLSNGYINMNGAVQPCSLIIAPWTSVVLIKTGATCAGGIGPDIIPPTVSLSAPLNGQFVAGTIPVTMAATAEDNIAVAKVDFYRGTTFLGSDADSPYSISWNTSIGGTGTAVLTAKATDTSGNTATSNAVTVTVGGSTNIAPTANAGVDKTITLPTNSVTLSGSGSDSDGTIASYAWTKVSGSGTIVSPSAATTSITGLTQGTATYRLTVTDNAGATGSDDVNIVVNQGTDTTAPTFIAPYPISISGQTGNIDFFVGASDNVAMSKVDFYVDGALIGSDNSSTPYGYTWNSTVIANGSHTATAKAYDTAGNVATSSAVGFIVANPDIIAPTNVAITAPSAGAVLSNSVNITAVASDNVGVDHVDFYRGTTLIGGNTTAPFTIAWNTTNVIDGTYTLTARAYDAAGNSTTSSAVSVSVLNVVIPPPDTTAPTVAMTAPANGATVSGQVTLAANASDTESGITKVQFYRGTTLIDTDTTGTPGYAVLWDTTAVANGTYTLTAKATDGATIPNTGTSTAITVTVANDLTSPVVSLTAPATTNLPISGTFTLKATATDNVAMSKVEFYRGTTLIGIQTSGPGSSFDLPWDTTAVSAGSYTITAKAFDTNGNTATTSARTVIVDNVVPTVSLTAPSSGYIKAGSRVTIKATASDTNGIAQVDFYVNGAWKCTSTTSPYSCVWVMPASPVGSYTLTATAFDKAGNSKTTSDLKTTNHSLVFTGQTFTFSPIEVTKTQTLLSPKVTVTSENTITKVEFYLDDTLIGTDKTQSPYDINGGKGFSIKTTPKGFYSLTVKAYDNLGNVDVSAPVTIPIL